MYEVCWIRQVLALLMLSAAAYFDIKMREVNDIIWIIFGGVGVVMYLFEPVYPLVAFYLVFGVSVGAIWILTRVFGQADGLAVIALSITFPIHDNLPVGLLVSIGAPFLASLYGICYNVAYNTSDLVHGRMFLGVCENRYRKAFAFLVLHRRRPHERFVFPAQNKGRLIFHFRPKSDQEFAGRFDGYVTSAIPLIPFMLGLVILIDLL